MKPTPTFSALLLLLFFVLATSLLGQDTVKRNPVPADTAQTEATKLIKEVYGDESAKAKSATDKRVLAKKLLEKANESKDDTASQFTLLRIARDISTQANDGRTAYQAIDAMAESFQVDPIKMKMMVLTKLASVAQTPAEHKSIAAPALNLLRACKTINYRLRDRVRGWIS